MAGMAVIILVVVLYISWTAGMLIGGCLVIVLQRVDIIITVRSFIAKDGIY